MTLESVLEKWTKEPSIDISQLGKGSKTDVACR
jgi:hypothetical protein